MSKELKDLTFQELVNEASVDVHGDLLIKGGEGMKSAIFRWMYTAIEWNKEQEKKKNEK